jgi:hypothetical protein
MAQMNGIDPGFRDNITIKSKRMIEKKNNPIARSDVFVSVGEDLK